MASPIATTSESPSKTLTQTALSGSVGITGITRVPPPVNEPNLGYLPGSPERSELKNRLSVG